MRKLFTVLSALLATLILTNKKEAALFLAMLLDKKQEIKNLSTAEAKDFKSPSSDSSLVKHMNTFAAADGFIDKQSIFEACVKKWHLSEEQANTLASGTLQVAFYRGVPGVSFSFEGGVSGRFLAKDAVGLLTHPSDTGLYDMKNGTVNNKQFDMLEKYAIVDADGEKLISQSRLTAYLKDFYKIDNRWKDAPALFKFIGEKGNIGEFEIFFKRAVSRWKLNTITNQMEGCVTLSELKYFLTDSQPMVNAVKSGELPAALKTPKLSIGDRIINAMISASKDIVKECPNYFPPQHTYLTSQQHTFFKEANHAPSSGMTNALFAPQPMMQLKF